MVDATVELWMRRSAGMLSRGGSETDTDVLQVRPLSAAAVCVTGSQIAITCRGSSSREEELVRKRSLTTFSPIVLLPLVLSLPAALSLVSLVCLSMPTFNAYFLPFGRGRNINVINVERRSGESTV